MIASLTILALAVIWSVLSGQLSLFNLLVGALLGVVLLSVVLRSKERPVAARIVGIVYFIIRFVIALVRGGLTVAGLAIQFSPSFHPHVVSVPLRVRSDAAISLLSAAITLLPGTVAMGTSADSRILYAHAIGRADPEDSRNDIRIIEDLILRFMA